MKNILTAVLAVALTATAQAVPAFSPKDKPVEAAKPAGKPNFIFILADDLGIDGVSCYGADKRRSTQAFPNQ